MFSNPICHSEPYGRRISFRLFAEFILSEILQSLLSLRMTRSEGLRVTFWPISKHSQEGTFDKIKDYITVSD